MTVSRFSRQTEAALRVLNFVLWENLVLVVVLVLESKGPYFQDRWETFPYQSKNSSFVTYIEVQRNQYTKQLRWKFVSAFTLSTKATQKILNILKTFVPS